MRMRISSWPWDELRTLLRRIGQLWLAYLRGQLLMALVVGGLTWLVGWGLGVRWAFGLGAFAGALNLVPGLGLTITLLAGFTVAVWQGSSWLTMQSWLFGFLVVGAFLLVQWLCSLLIEPRLVGQRVQMHPLVVLAGVLVGGIIGSVLGAYLAVPILVAVREVGRYVWRKAHRQPPFAAEE